MSIGYTESITEILTEVVKVKPQSILNVGVGLGTYGVLFRDILEQPKDRYNKPDWKIRIDGFEADRNCHNPIYDYVYDKIEYKTILNGIESLTKYDVVLLVDVLEHFEKEKGKEIVNSFLRITKKALVISTSLYPEQGKCGKPKSRWTQLDFTDYDFSYKLVGQSKNSTQIVILLPQVNHDKEFPIDQIPVTFNESNCKPLTIAYFLPHKNLTGGLKMLLEQMKHLRKRGHKIYAFFKGENADTALPSWMNLQVDKEIVVPKGKSYLSYMDDCDVGIIGWMDEIQELSKAKIPVVYWEQGHEYLFGDVLNQGTRVYLQHYYQQPVAVTSVSPLVSKILSIRYGRKAPVIPNGIDTDFYFPGQRANENTILLVGNPNLRFKGFDVALRTLFQVWRSGQKFKVKWVCQVKPALDIVPMPFSVEYVVMPTQEELAKHYRSSDLFLFTSWYEGFGMPPLEAMASGVPVVSTSCGGIDMYAKDGVNVLLAEPGDVDGLAKRVIQLLTNEKTRDDLSKRGRETALEFSFSIIIKKLEDYLYNLVAHIKQ